MILLLLGASALWQVAVCGATVQPNQAFALLIFAALTQQEIFAVGAVG
jgi:hypothetical protein